MKIIKSENSMEFKYLARVIRQLIIGIAMLLLTVLIILDALEDGSDWHDISFPCIIWLLIILGPVFNPGVLKYKIIVDSEGVHEKRFLLKNRTILWSDVTSIDVKRVHDSGRRNCFAVGFESYSSGGKRKVKIKTAPIFTDKYNEIKDDLYEIVKRYCRHGITELDGPFF